MIPPRQSAALNPLGLDFDRFLYAPVGDDQQGGLLSVISALARVGVDPWEEAALLARLPLDGAVQALCALLAKLPAGSGRPVDPLPVATHLVTLLPQGAHQPHPTQAPFAGGDIATAPSRWLLPLLCAIGLLLFLALHRLMA